MRVFLKLAALAAGAGLLLATARWVKSGADAQKSDWLYSDRIHWLGLIDLFVMGSVVAASLACGHGQSGRIPAFLLAVGLAVAALVGMVAFNTDAELVAELLSFCLSLGLMAVLTAMGRWTLLWLGIAAFAGTLPEVLELVSAALSFMHQ